MDKQEFVTSDTPYVSNSSDNSQPESLPKSNNIKGVITAGWVLAFVLPFVGVIINSWLLKNTKKYSLNIISVTIPLLISVLLSAAILFYLFNFIYFSFILK